MDASFRKFWTEVQSNWAIIAAVCGLAFWGTVAGARADARITQLEAQDVVAAQDHDLLIRMNGNVDNLTRNLDRMMDCQFDGRCKR